MSMVSSIEFQTFSLPHGDFKIAPLFGFGLKDIVEMSIYNWMLYEDFTHRLPLTYVLYCYSQPEGNRTLFHETLSDNLVKNLEFPFPYVDYNQTIQFELQVYNEFAFVSTVIETKGFVFYRRVALSPFNNTKPPKSCNVDDFKIGDQCLDQCPSSTFAIEGICYCHQSCQKCLFYNNDQWLIRQASK